MKSSIAAKIFRLAIVFVAIMIALVTFLLNQVRTLNRAIRDFSENDRPLDSSLVARNETGLHRSIASERSLQALIAGASREPALAEATANNMCPPAFPPGLSAIRVATFRADPPPTEWDGSCRVLTQ